jgi:subtilisin family serine protease/subtilisin-like proprotein convertase family protein
MEIPMSTSRDPSAPISRLTDLFRRAGGVGAASSALPALVETLEPRVLLSAVVELPEGVEVRAWNGGQVAAIEDSWIATFDRSVTKETLTAEFSKLVYELGISLDGYMHRGSRFVEFTTSDPLHEGAIEWVRGELGNLVNIEPNVAYAPTRVANDPLNDLAWWVDNVGQPIPGQPQGTPGADIGLEEAWEITTGSSGVVIAVVDTGVEWHHEDLADNIWSNAGEIAGNGIDDDGNGFVDDVRGWDFGTATFGPGGTGQFGGDNNPDDTSIGGGHGTAVAGTIGAVGNNGVGIAGVNWDVSILPIKIANEQGALVGGAIIAGHNYLTDLILRGVNIVASNNSYGAFSPAFFEEFEEFDFEREAIEDFIAAGATFVAAAGNDSNDNDDAFTAFPAAYNLPGIVAVAATNNRDELAGFSNFGATTVDVAAPGEAILTTSTNGTYTFIDGTSFASPMKTVRPDLTPEEVTQALIDSSDPIAALQGRVVANGRVNAERALQIITTDGPLVLQVSPGQTAGSPVNEIQVSFSEPVQALPVDILSKLSLIRSGGDGGFFDGNEVAVNLSTATLDATRTVMTVTPVGSLSAIDNFRFTIDNTAIRDDEGNFLNGDTSGGADEIYEFELILAPGIGEPNDQLSTATPAVIPGGGNGTVTFSGRTIGDGVNAALDVDLYRLDLPRGGLISARVLAQQLPTPSSLDGVLRLFDAAGQELAINDQFFGNDPFIDFFVPSAGVYYVGVSGFGNESYLPLIPASGQTQSRGNYNLRLDVALIGDAEISQGNSYAAPGRTIPDQSVLIDSIFISDAREIRDVDVTVNINHDFVSDLSVSLVGPQGQVVQLFNGIGAAADDVTNAVFDDEATRSITSATAADAPFTGAWRPQGDLSVLDGNSAAGTWQLVIRDTKGNDIGSLLNWSLDLVLENDIFGPFELNDTLTTARVIEPAQGVVQFNAFLGDGGFGALDVDLYQFQAAAGSTLNVQVSSGGVADLAIRLFDESGNELQASNPAGELDAAIEGFVFVDGGTYFIGISDSTRAVDPTAYDPTVVGSGGQGATVGNYGIEVQLASGVSDPGVLLSGDRLDVGISPSGAWGFDGSGFVFDGVEVIPGIDGSRPAFYGVSSESGAFVNDGDGSSQDVPFNVTSQSTPGVNRVAISGVTNGFRVDRSISYGLGDGFIAIDVVLTNTTDRRIRDVLWAEGFNPDQNLGSTGSLFTINDVVDGQPMAVATGTDGLAIALAADPTDARATAFFASLSADVRNPQSVVDRMVADPNGVSSDLTMALSYDIGDVDPGQSATMRYFVFLSDQGQEGIAGANGLQATATATRADMQRLDTGLLTYDPTAPADDSEGLADLAYRQYYPEGFANDRASTFVPLTNFTNTDARVVVIVRYEDPSIGIRDQVIFDGMVAANTRSPDALTITTPELYAAGSATNVFNETTGMADGVFKDTPYALEIRSSAPVAATMSHFDFGSSTGEVFSGTASELWSFASVSIGEGSSDFVTFQNTTGETTKVSLFLFPLSGQSGSSAAVELVYTLEGYRRGGWNFNNELANGQLAGVIQPGRYGVSLIATEPIVAASSSFRNGAGASQLGEPNLGATQGAIAEGQIGQTSESETISVFNPSSSSATVTLQFIFETGGAIRQTVDVAPGRVSLVQVEDIALFPEGTPYGVFYESTEAVVVASSTRGLGDALASSTATDAHSLWGFSEGFAPIQGGQVQEYVRVYNPGLNDSLLEITFRFTDGSTETFRRVAGASRISEFNLRNFISSSRFEAAQADGAAGVFYGFTVKSSSGIVAYQGRTDSFFGGGFGTLGVPLGVESGIA